MTTETEITRKGRGSLSFQNPPELLESACAAGTKEGEGPLAGLFDLAVTEDSMGQNSWEEAESELQKQTALLLLKKAGLGPEAVSFLFAGDLLGQLIATSFGLMELQIPLYGLYGACSTFGEAMSLGAVFCASGAGERCMALASSHFATAEKEFRFPLGYGNQRPLSASWTATGCGAVLIGRGGSNHCGKQNTGAGRSEQKAGADLPDQSTGRNQSEQGTAVITGTTTGRIVDFGLKDSMNMGAAMAPAAFYTILQNLKDFSRQASDYDRIITGDLGAVGQKILLDLLLEQGIDLRGIHMDCGLELYDRETQDVHAGGSGCGCSAVVFASLILPKIRSGEWKRVLFLPTGALLSTVSYNEGQSVPGIAHGIVLEHRD